MSFLERIEAANRGALQDIVPFRIGARRLGLVRRGFAERLGAWPDVFVYDPDGQPPALSLHPALTGAGLEARSEAVAGVLEALRAGGEFGGLWWNEKFAVNGAFHEAPELLLERAALQHFGVCGYGVHLNGYQRDPASGALSMWVARRALDKPVDPGKLDQLVAGGQPAGLGLRENMIKECAEEAGMPRRLAERMTPVGAISYCLETPYGVRPDVIYNFDLELPVDYRPVNADGEVEAFYLWPIGRVLETVRDSEAFKFNCSLVVIDFLIRHGLIEPEHPDYLTLQTGLRQRDRRIAATIAR